MKLTFNTAYFGIAILLFSVEVCIALFLKTGFIRHTFGDYLVVIMLYALLRSLTNLSLYASALLVLAIAFAIEFLQLTPVLHYFNLDNNIWAKLILGTTFQWGDLAAYTLGIITVLLIEKQTLWST